MENTKHKSEFIPPTKLFETWGDIISYYGSFLRGEIKGCLTHLIPESSIISKELISINSYGVLTLESQTGTVEKYVDIFNGRNETSYQRSYLISFMPYNLCHKIKQYFLGSEIIVSSSWANIHTTSFTNETELTSIHTSYSTHIGKTGEKIKTSGSGITFENSTKELNNILNYCSDKLKMSMNNIFCVIFIDPVWGRETKLFEAICEALEK